MMHPWFNDVINYVLDSLLVWPPLVWVRGVTDFGEEIMCIDYTKFGFSSTKVQPISPTLFEP